MPRAVAPLTCPRFAHRPERRCLEGQHDSHMVPSNNEVTSWVPMSSSVDLTPLIRTHGCVHEPVRSSQVCRSRRRDRRRRSGRRPRRRLRGRETDGCRSGRRTRPLRARAGVGCARYGPCRSLIARSTAANVQFSAVRWDRRHHRSPLALPAGDRLLHFRIDCSLLEPVSSTFEQPHPLLRI